MENIMGKVLLIRPIIQCFEFLETFSFCLSTSFSLSFLYSSLSAFPFQQSLFLPDPAVSSLLPASLLQSFSGEQCVSSYHSAFSFRLGFAQWKLSEECKAVYSFWWLLLARASPNQATHDVSHGLWSHTLWVALPISSWDPQGHPLRILLPDWIAVLLLHLGVL